jgi:hypothetical protein
MDVTDRIRSQIRIVKHEAVPKCGSCEVRFADGRDTVRRLCRVGVMPTFTGSFVPPLRDHTRTRPEPVCPRLARRNQNESRPRSF